MKFRTISRLHYLKRAKHRHGHGIHSPFLFHLITNVIEDRRRPPEYKIYKNLRINALILLADSKKLLLSNICNQFNLPLSKQGKIFKKIELPIRYGKVIFRLIKEFKPTSVLNFGPALGINLALMAMANRDTPVYQIINQSACDLFSRELLKDSTISNIHYLAENHKQQVSPDFIVINHPNDPKMSGSISQNFASSLGVNGVLIIRGIHESKEMEIVWNELIANVRVRVSLDLFEVGIALFRTGLQKENFILRY